MKGLSLFVLCVCGAFAQIAPDQLVYVMPMAGGLDQHLADWITREHVMQVTTDLNAADTVLTDRLGEAFERRLADMRKPKADPASGKDDKDLSKSAGATTHNPFRSSAPMGTMFLVDLKTGKVLWSDHEKPRTTSDSGMDREARRIVKKLQQTSTPTK
jgi:hypothetical protein